MNKIISLVAIIGSVSAFLFTTGTNAAEQPHAHGPAKSHTTNAPAQQNAYGPAKSHPKRVGMTTSSGFPTSRPTVSRPTVSRPAISRPSNFQGNASDHHHHVNSGYSFPVIPYVDTFDYSPDYDSTTEESTEQSEPVQNYNVPAGVWVAASNGDVPDNAIVYQTDSNNNPVYYCRAQYNNQILYGVLSPGSSCYYESEDNSIEMQFSSYEVLVGSAAE